MKANKNSTALGGVFTLVKWIGLDTFAGTSDRLQHGQLGWELAHVMKLLDQEGT